MATLISTSAQPAGDQADYWRSVISSAFGQLQVLPPDRDGFAARILARTLGPVEASQVEAPAHAVRRSARQVARDSRECYKLGLVLRGSCLLRQHGREVLVEPGDVVLYDLTEPVEIDFTAHRIFTLVVPHKAIPLPTEHVARLAGTLLTDRVRTGRLVTSVLTTLADDGDAAEGPHAHHLGAAVLELVTGAMSERLGEAVHPCDAPAAHTELLHCIEDWIERRLEDPGLSPATIAQAHHISVRQLHRLFQAKGITVARHVRTRRLEHCRRELRDPRLATQRISAIAYRWGFPDAAAFSRVFRAAYGASPSDYRAAITGIGRDGGAGPLSGAWCG